ncbi:hypothetical protein BRADI_2g23793v3 [Brachypodium distachyon]|uniref:Uncharacterized protein n=1 Tax=Brachypodium distachyon TaxID=15368 RepID=A0A2K2DA44_BRADI|nr:hypothetical protein BRADI_2g23793v3 [Brachypodium distachyon]
MILRAPPSRKASLPRLSQSKGKEKETAVCPSRATADQPAPNAARCRAEPGLACRCCSGPLVMVSGSANLIRSTGHAMNTV